MRVDQCAKPCLHAGMERSATHEENSERCSNLLYLSEEEPS
jgi:hypothetical protein